MAKRQLEVIYQDVHAFDVLSNKSLTIEQCIKAIKEKYKWFSGILALEVVISDDQPADQGWPIADSALTKRYRFQIDEEYEQ